MKIAIHKKYAKQSKARNIWTNIMENSKQCEKNMPGKQRLKFLEKN